MNSPDSSQVSMSAVGATVAMLPAVALEQYSFFQALRQIERERTALPRIGYAARPTQEPVRIGQPAELTFAPSTLASPAESTFTRTRQHAVDPKYASAVASAPVAIQQRFLGLLGPAGPMPLHYTETVRDRKRHSGDESLQAFLDIFHHRLGVLFYRAWSDAQPVVQQDRPDTDRFGTHLGAICGVGSQQDMCIGLAQKESQVAGQATTQTESRNHHGDPQAARHEGQTPGELHHLANIHRYFAGHFSGLHRHADGLQSLLTSALQMPASVQAFALRTLTLASAERTSLCSFRRNGTMPRTNGLGLTAQLGSRVADRSSMIDVRLSPNDLKQFQQLLPGGYSRRLLTAIVSRYIGPAIDARITVVLKRNHVPRVSLGQAGQLGRTTWLGSASADRERDDYRFEICTSGEGLADTERTVASTANGTTSLHGARA